MSTTSYRAHCTQLTRASEQHDDEQASLTGFVLVARGAPYPSHVRHEPTLAAMPRDILSEQQCNIEFVKNVQKFPCLYNFELPSYTRKDISDKAWEEVAETMNMTREFISNMALVVIERAFVAPPRVR